MRRCALLAAGLLSLAAWLLPTAAQADEARLYYYYPYYYYPTSYWPNYYQWPDPKVPFQPAPPYMAYPKERDNFYRYEILELRRYYRGNHFFLDQF
jgi:hypothetical protein